ncbi:anthranilate phosphoribosyltransferase [Halalkalibacter nanhaiisediminis]|uniref:Anthranilate phosphoribosyltransferase n=1 Tax=Halalkalibacter nanhaiisediminis TaxID=688079 RepID=A0A562QQ28_9BACI|nr:anthranilate phosphoribosyltransferase [Halalkalibacter nanhaiisediminis]TWI58861.1 anthranilate phosphoribosyltransferase [Halalkalibacter nanhaiisediminis]
MLKEILKSCMEGHTMTKTEAEKAMNQIMNGEATPSQIASLLTIMRFRGETVDEMTGFARSMRAHSVKIPADDLPVVDTCGTGGDDLGTFNISTATAIVLSAIGVPVAKHGNRAVSSKSGSADVLEELKISIQHSPEEAYRSLQESNLCFLFAPLYHQSMKHAVAPRKEIGFRTIFNMLGPLTNPANAKYQLIGVYDTEFAAKMAETLGRLGTTRTLFVTGGEGLDELSITNESTVIEVNGTDITTYTLTPEDVGLKRGKLEEIQVATPAESAALIEKILKGTANPSAEGIVMFNAAAALYAAKRVESINEGVELVSAAIKSGSVYQHFQTLQTEKEETEQHA